MFDFSSLSWSDWGQIATTGATLFGSKTASDGQRAGGAAAKAYGAAQDVMAQHDAAGEEDAARAMVEKILRAAKKQKGAARAATAASGVRIDEFALAPEQEIEELAQEDAAMTILSGKRRADSIRLSGRMARLAGGNEAAAADIRANTTLFQGADAALRGLSGWKGAQGALKTVPIYENPEY
jgi:uncharacterized protein YcaQ